MEEAMVMLIMAGLALCRQRHTYTDESHYWRWTVIVKIVKGQVSEIV